MKKKVSLFATAMTLMLALSIVFGFGAAVSVSATVQTCSEEVYYFTDNDECDSVRSNAIDMAMSDAGWSFDAQVHVYDWSFGKTVGADNEQFWNRVWEFDQEGGFNSIQNVYVIFECRNKIEYRLQSHGEDIPDILDRVFETLHDNGCKIAFISGTDEYVFGAKTHFLTYADVHINCDFRFTFATSTIDRIEEECQFENCLIIIDQSLVSGNPFSWNSWFLDGYADGYGYYNYGMSFAGLLGSKEGKLIVQVDGNEFFDATANRWDYMSLRVRSYILYF